jgi:hypothetical protein
VIAVGEVLIWSSAHMTDAQLKQLLEKLTPAQRNAVKA